MVKSHEIHIYQPFGVDEQQIYVMQRPRPWKPEQLHWSFGGPILRVIDGVENIGPCSAAEKAALLMNKGVAADRLRDALEKARVLVNDVVARKFYPVDDIQDAETLTEICAALDFYRKVRVDLL